MVMLSYAYSRQPGSVMNFVYNSVPETERSCTSFKLPSVQGYWGEYCSAEEVCTVILAHILLLPAILSKLGFPVRQQSHQILERIADLTGQVMTQDSALLTWGNNGYLSRLGCGCLLATVHPTPCELSSLFCVS